MKKALLETEIPTDIRSYIAANQPGTAIGFATQFDTEKNNKYTEVQINNGLLLLFDDLNNFICARTN